MRAMLWTAIVISSSLVFLGCGGKDKKPPRSSDDPTSMYPSMDGDDDNYEPEVYDAENIEFDKEQAQTVMERGARKAAQCPAVTEDVPIGEGEITVVFDGPKGRVVDVELGSYFATGSEQAQRCIKNSFIGEIIPNFKGKQTVAFTLTIPEKSEDEED